MKLQKSFIFLLFFFLISDNSYLLFADTSFYVGPYSFYRDWHGLENRSASSVKQTVPTIASLASVVAAGFNFECNEGRPKNNTRNGRCRGCINCSGDEQFRSSKPLSPVEKLYQDMAREFLPCDAHQASLYCDVDIIGNPISPEEKRRRADQDRRRKAEAKKRQEAEEKIQRSSYQEIAQLNENETLFSREDVVQECRSEWGKRIARRRRAIKYVLDYEEQYVKKRFSISQKTVEFLRYHGFDEAQYQECQGNELQQVIHQEFVEIVLDTTDLSEKEKRESVEQFQKLILSCSRDGCGLNQQGKVFDAMRISDFCQTALDAGSTILKARLVKTGGRLHTLELEALYGQAFQATEVLDKNLFSQKSLENFAALQTEQFTEKQLDFDNFICCLGGQAKYVFGNPRQSNTKQFWPEVVAQRLEYENERADTLQQVVQKRIQKKIPHVSEMHEGLLAALAENDLPPWYDHYLWKEHAQNYEDALKNISAEDSCSEIKVFTFSDQLKKLVTDCGADTETFTFCEGNEVQQVLHQGFVDDIDSISQLDTKKLDHDERKLVHALQSLTVSYAQCGCFHNKAGDIQNAWALSQVCGVLRDYAKASALGVCDGVKDVGDIFLHPVDTVCTFGHVLWFTTSNTASFLCDCSALIDGILLSDQKKYQKALERIDSKVDAVKKTLDNVWATIQNSPGEDRARFIARMATGIALQKPSFRLAGKIFTNAKTAAKNLLHSKPMVQFSDGVKMTVRATRQVGENIVAGGRQAVDAARRAILQPLARARLAVRTVTKKACKPCKQLIEEGKCFFEHGCSRCRDAAISSERALVRALRRCHPKFRQLVESGHEVKGMKVVLKRIKLGLSESEFMKLRKFFNTIVETTGGLGGIEVPRRFILEESFWRHIFMGELEVLMESTGRIGKRLSGFHHDLNWKDVGRDLLKLTNQVYDKGRHILQADLADSARRVVKTFYPKHWSSEKVAEKIVEALKNIEGLVEESGRMVMTGRTKCGVEIKIVAEEGGKLVTAFPLV